MLLNSNATRFFFFFTILNQKEFRIATVAMFICDFYAGGSCPADVATAAQPRTAAHDYSCTTIDFLDIFNRGRSVVSWTLYG